MIPLDAKDALERDLRGLRADKRVHFLRAYLDFVVAHYAKALNDAERQQVMEEDAGEIRRARDLWPWLKPLPTPREILAMSRKDARGYQTLIRFKDGSVWIANDHRFLNRGAGLGFKRAWEEAWDDRVITKGVSPEQECLSDEEATNAVARNEVSPLDVTQYQEGIENGTIAIEVRQGSSTRELHNCHKQPLLIDSQEWPTVEHFILAQQFNDQDLRETIRACQSLVDARKAIRGLPAREDWPQVRDELIKKALDTKFQSPRLRAVLLHTSGFRIFYQGAGAYWGGRKNRMGQLLMDLRERIAEEGEIYVRVIRRKEGRS